MRQGANSIQAAVIDVNREKHTLVADGNVVTNLWENPRATGKTPAAPCSPWCTLRTWSTPMRTAWPCIPAGFCFAARGSR